MAKKEKTMDSYNGISYQECWNMDLKLAGMISTHLHAFYHLQKSHDGGYPAIFDSIYGRERGQKEWHNTLRKMMFAFDQYGITKWDTEKDPEVQERIKEGMQLFVEYFHYLWI